MQVVLHCYVREVPTVTLVTRVWQGKHVLIADAGREWRREIIRTGVDVIILFFEFSQSPRPTALFPLPASLFIPGRGGGRINLGGGGR